MIIYHYHPDTKEYLGQGIADESPLEPGVYLIPAYATTIKPDASLGIGQKLIFDNQKWVIVDLTEPEQKPKQIEEELIEYHNEEIKYQIAAIELKQLRATREAWLGYDGAKERLQALDDQISALRSQIK